jgi:hypothetical protein
VHYVPAESLSVGCEALFLPASVTVLHLVSSIEDAFRVEAGTGMPPIEAIPAVDHYERFHTKGREAQVPALFCRCRCAVGKTVNLGVNFFTQVFPQRLR